MNNEALSVYVTRYMGAGPDAWSVRVPPFKSDNEALADVAVELKAWGDAGLHPIVDLCERDDIARVRGVAINWSLETAVDHPPLAPVHCDVLAKFNETARELANADPFDFNHYILNTQLSRARHHSVERMSPDAPLGDIFDIRTERVSQTEDARVLHCVNIALDRLHEHLGMEVLWGDSGSGPYRMCFGDANVYPVTSRWVAAKWLGAIRNVSDRSAADDSPRRFSPDTFQFLAVVIDVLTATDTQPGWPARCYIANSMYYVLDRDLTAFYQLARDLAKLDGRER